MKEKLILIFFVLFLAGVPTGNAHTEEHGYNEFNCTDPSGIRNVTLTIIEPLGGIQEYLMFDDGKHGDGGAGDSRYGVFFNTSEEGIYPSKIICVDGVGHEAVVDPGPVFYHAHPNTDSVMKSRFYFGREFWDYDILITNPDEYLNFNFNLNIEKPASNVNFEVNGENIKDLKEFDDRFNRYFYTEITLDSGQNHFHYDYERGDTPFKPTNFILPIIKISISKFPFDSYDIERNVPQLDLEYPKSRKLIIELESPYVLDRDKSKLFVENAIGEPKSLEMDFEYIGREYSVSIDSSREDFLPRKMILTIMPPPIYKFIIFLEVFGLIVLTILEIKSRNRLDDYFNGIPILKLIPERLHWIRIRSGIVALSFFISLRIALPTDPIIIPHESLNANLTFLDIQTWILILAVYSVALTIIEHIFAKDSYKKAE